MRITENGMARTVLHDLMMNRNRLSSIYEQLSSGSRINRPSDDPGGTVTVMQVRSSLAEIEQFKTNTTTAMDLLSMGELALNEASEALNRLRELVIQGSNDILPDASLDSLGQMADGLVDHLLSLGNTQHAGRYLFAGYQTRTLPFSIEDSVIHYAGDDGIMVHEVGPGIQMAMNVPGDRIFSDVLDVAVQVRDALLDRDSEAIRGQLDALDAAGDAILAVRSQIGGRMNRLELGRNRLEDMEISLARVMSETADVDLAEMVMRLATAEQAYQTSLATGARILPPTLLDYLR